MMEIRHATNPVEAKQYTTERLRQEYLIEDLFQPDQIKLVYTHHDRVIVGGAVPVKETLALEVPAELRTDYFLERREVGFIAIGGPTVITIDGEEHLLQHKDGLYVGKGAREVSLRSQDPSQPAKVYFVSTLAHQSYPTAKIALAEANPVHLGSLESSNERTIYQYIHADGVQSCQLMMGMTLLKPNNIWNTMPPHLHDRRMEVYLYFDMDEQARVFHLMGEPQETRHLVVKNEQAVISPSWSIHSGAGTSPYTFIWAMGGENYTFKDMDAVAMEDLK
ncbi:4-deoxy-L-threo-5-hexulose uronate isomerase [Desmospora activa DSM 45169]|uniref:4-deoxy-L-threo-5-hexosulose-uronate ketol-isomerase n=2 Tax=Desmospora TaxID=500614 RepID=A0A2T4ZDL8_9BACL|nr:4-deoxy-L-threo-5-hexulose uronate isomerase [Desmospora activa DSM 45169]